MNYQLCMYIRVESRIKVLVNLTKNVAIKCGIKLALFSYIICRYFYLSGIVTVRFPRHSYFVQETHLLIIDFDYRINRAKATIDIQGLDKEPYILKTYSM